MTRLSTQELERGFAGKLELVKCDSAHCKFTIVIFVTLREPMIRILEEF